MSLSTLDNNLVRTGIRILVVDDEREIQMQHEDLLTEWGYIPFVAQGEGEALASSARELVKRHRCHIALVDKQLWGGGSNDWSGLELVPTLRPALSIIVSGSGQRKPAVAALQKYHAVGFVGKEDGPLELRWAIEQVVRNHQVGARPGVVIWPYGLDSSRMRDMLLHDPEHEGAPDDEVDEVICRLFPNAQRVTLSLDLESQEHEPQVSALRRASRVFLAFVDDAPAIRVVKMAPVSRIEREIYNYDYYVEQNLVGLVRPEKYSQVVLWDFGAVAYSFLGNNSLDPSGKLPTFFEHYRANNQPDIILAPLRHFFESCKEWYRLHFKPLDGTLLEAYDASWEGALSREFQRWRSDDYILVYTMAGRTAELPNPTRWLVDHVQDSYHVRGTYQALTHGDMHCDNLFVDDNRAWPIDFDQTGPGPILRDFVVLSSDILIRAMQLDIERYEEVVVFYDLVVALCTPAKPDESLQWTRNIFEHREARKAFVVIEELRSLASQRAGHIDQREYLWGLLLHSLLHLCLLPKQDARRNRVQLLASIICVRLERWGMSSWLPNTMPIVNWLNEEDFQDFAGQAKILRRRLNMLQSQRSMQLDGMQIEDEDTEISNLRDELSYFDVLALRFSSF